MYSDICVRSFNFSLQIISLVAGLRQSRMTDLFGMQLARAGTSVGANIEEARAAYSRREYAYKLSIALKEARETHYWLRLLRDSGIAERDQLMHAVQEAEEISIILGAIVSKLRGTSKFRQRDVVTPF